jgi:hypothetical protein
MDFKILWVVSSVEDDNDCEKPHYLYAKMRGYSISAICLQDNKPVRIFVPSSKIKDMDDIKARLKRRYQFDRDFERAQREAEARAKKQEIEDQTIIANLTGAIIDP